MEVLCNCMKKLNRSLAGGGGELFSFFMRALSQPFHFPQLFPGKFAIQFLQSYLNAHDTCIKLCVISTWVSIIIIAFADKGVWCL